jgi:hypothetical protein
LRGCFSGGAVARKKKVECEKAREVRNWWDSFAALFWAGRLESPTTVKVLPAEMMKNSRRESMWAHIVKHTNGHLTLCVSEKLFEIGDTSFLKLVILHEQIHASVGVGPRHDTEAWLSEVHRLSMLGALREVI